MLLKKFRHQLCFRLNLFVANLITESKKNDQPMATVANSVAHPTLVSEHNYALFARENVNELQVLQESGRTDIPVIATVKPGCLDSHVFNVECIDWTRTEIGNNDTSDDIRDVDLTSVFGPIAVESGVEPGDCIFLILDDYPLPLPRWKICQTAQFGTHTPSPSPFLSDPHLNNCLGYHFNAAKHVKSLV
ncbi:hypothetical protein P692DRAFT_20823046 [Suillus brevipes Sb2]|nr:hypothetical protein P692DRAFT_20823046 [Suillus brevipes Sb2]